jgi:hypothetical protein
MEHGPMNYNKNTQQTSKYCLVNSNEQLPLRQVPCNFAHIWFKDICNQFK